MAGQEARPRVTSSEVSRRVVFWIEIAYLLLLGAVGWLYVTDTMPAELAVPDTLGPLPVGVPWYGALGGVIISLTGVFEHAYDWDPRYFFWHLGRPFVGAAVAIVAVLIVQAGILAAGVEPTDDTGGTGDLFYYVVAFIVGYREESFRGMIKRVADVILTSETPGGPPVITSFTPSKGEPGSEVTITGSGLKGTRVVRFGMTESPHFRISSDAEIIALVPDMDGSGKLTLLNDKGSTTSSEAFEVKAAG